jgi:hypothetical protein
MPVRTPEDAAGVVAKILGYEEASKTNHAVMVADKIGYFEFDYAKACRDVEALLPSSIAVEEIFRGDFNDDLAAKDAVIASINSGSLLVNYIGDGSVEIWEKSITSDDAPFFTNGLQLPLFLNMTTMKAYSDFIPRAQRPPSPKRLIAVWASSGLTNRTGCHEQGICSSPL